MIFDFKKTIDPEFQHLKSGLLTGEDMHSLACSFTVRNESYGLGMLFGIHKPETILTEAIRTEKSKVSHFLIHQWSNDAWELDQNLLLRWLNYCAEKDPATGVYYSYCVTKEAVYIAMIRPDQADLCVVRCYNLYLSTRVVPKDSVTMEGGQIKFTMDLSWEEASMVHTALLALAVSKPEEQKKAIRELDKRLIDGWNSFQNGLASQSPDRDRFEVIQSYVPSGKEVHHG